MTRNAVDCVPCLFHTYYLRDGLLHNTDKVWSEHPHWLESYSDFDLLKLLLKHKTGIHDNDLCINQKMRFDSLELLLEHF